LGIPAGTPENLTDGLSADGASATPLLRGVLHQYAFYFSLPAGALLIAGTRSDLGLVAASIFAAGVASMFGASALYHRVRWRPALRRWMRRADHTGIYLMIAGSYTPYGLLVLEGAWRITILAIVWSGVAAAIALRFAWFGAPGWLTATIGVVLGWISVVALPKAFGVLGPAGLALLLSGGVFYTAGALVYAIRRPNPFPRVFGFHELFHALVIVAVACQYAAVAFFVLPEW
jgi:hemolysin III